MQVTKTLVIGLGSTGTRIVEAVAQHVSWELQNIQRAPWIRYLCIETDSNNVPNHLPITDFVPLTIGADDWYKIVQSPEDYDEVMHLTKWADLDTLRKLPESSVSAGAGNIRMVGRVAFLFPTNFERVHHAVIERIAALRSLTPADAQEAFGKLADGSYPDIQFGSNNVFVFVVGTLCGGTCSGLAADFGYFLRTCLQGDDRLFAIFTLPRADLSETHDDHHNRHKKNAYSALVELNQYCLLSDTVLSAGAIRYPNGLSANVRTLPYDLIHLTMPRAVNPRSINELTTAIADYIFLNAFVPATLPVRYTVDTQIPKDGQHHAHAFSTFGLSTLEYPAQRVIEACTKRLMVHTISRWLGRSSNQDRIDEWLNSAGIEWEGISRLLFTVVEDIDKEAIEPQMFDVFTAVSLFSPEAGRLLSILRQLFDPLDEPPSAGDDRRGKVYRAVMANRRAAADKISENIRARLGAILRDYRLGPRVAAAFLSAVETRLNEIETEAANVAPPQEAVLPSIPPRPKSPFEKLIELIFRPRPRPSGLPDIFRTSLEQEIEGRKNQMVARALLDRTTDLGTTQHGIISIVREEVRVYRRRLANLIDRLMQLQAWLDKTANQLATEDPDINGVCLFIPEAAGQGTVLEEFRACLEAYSSKSYTSWEEERENLATEIVSSVLSKLSNLVVMSTNVSKDLDLLLQPTSNLDPRHCLPDQVLREMEETAYRPFLRLKDVNILTKLQQMESQLGKSWQALVQQAAQKADTFLDVNEALAKKGGFSAIQSPRQLLVPRGENARLFEQTASHVFQSSDTIWNSDPNRVIFLRSRFRFPLRAVTSIVGENGLAQANCGDFPSFYTRKDIPWIGLTEREQNRLRKAEECVAVATLLEILVPRGGGLTMEIAPIGPGDDGIRRLPLNFASAAYRLALGDRELDGKPIGNLLSIIEARIESKRKEFADKGGDVAFVQHLNEQLRAKVGGEVKDWSVEWFRERFERFCAADKQLAVAFDHVFPPDPDFIARMRFSKGEVLPGTAGECPEDGIYCLQCGGFIGSDERDAARRGWRCEVDPQNHYFGQQVRIRKG